MIADLRVMSFNIRYGLAEDGENDWKYRKHLVAGVIFSQSPDILCLQEGLRFQLDDLTPDMHGYQMVGVGRDDGKARGEFTAIYYRQNRFALLEQGTFWFSDTPHIPGSAHWGNFLPRICTWARLRCSNPLSEFTIYNAHWDHASQSARRRSAKMLIARVAVDVQAGLPVIVCGDFNAGEDNLAFRNLVNEKRGFLRDSYRVVHPKSEPAGTFHGFTGRHDGEKIDAVLVSSHWQVKGAGIVRTYFQDQETGERRYPSDHFPVTAAFSL